MNDADGVSRGFRLKKKGRLKFPYEERKNRINEQFEWKIKIYK